MPSDTATWLADGVTTHPTFFGCSSSDPVPLVIYLPNGAPPLGQPPLTNISTFATAFEPEQIEAAISQTFDLTTQGIATETNGVWEKVAAPAALALALREGTEVDFLITLGLSAAAAAGAVAVAGGRLHDAD